MPSNLDAICEAIARQLRTVPGLKQVVTYEPDQAGPCPMIFLDMAAWTLPAQTMNAMAMDWEIHGYLVLAAVGNNAKNAATLARQLLPPILYAIGQDLKAGGTIEDGQVLLTGAPRGRVVVGKTLYYARRLEFRVIEFLTDTYAIKEVG